MAKSGVPRGSVTDCAYVKLPIIKFRADAKEGHFLSDGQNTGLLSNHTTPIRGIMTS